jgi:hypothetical protein
MLHGSVAARRAARGPSVLQRVLLAGREAVRVGFVVPPMGVFASCDNDIGRLAAPSSRVATDWTSSELQWGRHETKSRDCRQGRSYTKSRNLRHPQVGARRGPSKKDRAAAAEVWGSGVASGGSRRQPFVRPGSHARITDTPPFAVASPLPLPKAAHDRPSAGRSRPTARAHHRFSPAVLVLNISRRGVSCLVRGFD